MGITLTGKRVQNTYDSLLKLSSNDNLTSTPQLVGDGLGNDSPIYLSETKVGIGVSPSFQFQTSDAAKIGGNLTVAGNLIVNGTTTQVDSTIVEIGDNMIELAKDNVANTMDIGWYGTIIDSGTKYVGMYYDASSDLINPTFYIGYGTTEPSSTASWTTKGKLVIGAIDSTGGTFSGQITIPETPTADGHAASKKYVDDQIGGVDKARRVTITVKNTETVALSAGTVVHAHPTAPVPSGNLVQVKKADYDTASLMPAIGILNEDLDAAGGTNDEGEAIMLGFINGIDTSGFSSGDELYVGNDGALTNSKPLLTTQLIQKIAVVMKVDSTNGSIEVFGAGRSNDVPNEVDRDLSIAGTLKVDDLIEIEADSGYGRLEVGGPDGGYIDLKTPFSDDYDLRIITNSSGSEFTGSGDFNLNAGNTLTLTLDGTTQDATFSNKISTTDGIVEIQKFSNTTGTTGTTLLELNHWVGTSTTTGDLSQQKTFIDFSLRDNNNNEYPQVRIGAEVGQNSDADSQIKEGSGAFLVYTNNSTGNGPTPTGLNERFRVDYQGNVGINVDNPQNLLHLYKNATQGNPSSHTPANATLRISDSANTIYLDGNSIIGTGSDAFTIGNTNAADIIFYTNASEIMRLDSSGNSTFEGRVDIKDDLRIRGAGGNPSQGIVRFYTDSTNKLNIDTGNTGTNLTTIDSSGNLDVAGTGSFDNTLIVSGVDTGNPNTSDSVLRVSGYGLLNYRSSFYITNSNSSGLIKLGIGNVHNVNPKLTLSSTTAEFDVTLNPSTDSTYDLGSTTKYWSNLYVDNITVDDKFNAPVTIQGASIPLLKLYQDTNGDGAAIEFSDQATTQTQKGFLTYKHTNTQSQNSGESFHFTGTETHISIVAGDGTQVGKFIASAGSTAGTAFGFYDDPDTGMYSGGANSVGLVAGGSRKLNVNSNGVTINNGNLYVPEYIYHDGDTNTYIRFVSEDRILIQNGQSSNIDLHSNGNNYYSANEHIMYGNVTLSSTGSVGLTINADTDNVTETDVPFLSFKMDGTQERLRIGVESSGNVPYISTDSDVNLGLSIKTGTANTQRIFVNTNGNIDFTANLLPIAENTYSIGSASIRWEDLYVDDGYIRNAYIDQYIYHNGDANTYIRFQTDDIQLVANSTLGVDINSSGQVGIGGSANYQALNVDGTIEAGGVSATNGALTLVQRYSGTNNDYIGSISTQYGSGAMILGYGARGKPGAGSTAFVSTFDNFSAVRGALRLKNGELRLFSSLTSVQTAVNSDLIMSTTFIVTADGLCGIGVSSPNNTLDIDSNSTNSVHIQGTGSYNLYSYHDSGGVGWATGAGSGYTNLIYMHPSTNSIRLYTNGSQAVHINSVGDMGISTNDPQAKLHVIGSTQFDRASATDPDATSRTRYPAAHMFTYTGDDNGLAVIGGQGGHTGTTLMLGQETGRSSAFKFIKGVSDTNGTVRDEFWVDGVGNGFLETSLAINSSNAHPLNVRKDGSSGSATIVAQFTSAASQRPTISFSESTATSITAGMSIEYNGVATGNDNYMAINAVTGSNAFKFYSGGVQTMVGNAPFIQMFANDEVDFGIQWYDNQDFGQNGKIHWSASTNDMTFVLNSNNRFRMYDTGDFHADGDVVAYSTSISDERLKDNVLIIDNALEKVKKLNGVSYIWNKGSRKGKKDLGVIAQEVEKVLPEIVHEKEMSLLDGETYKTVDYEKITAVLIESVKELSAKVEALENRNCNCNCK